MKCRCFSLWTRKTVSSQSQTKLLRLPSTCRAGLPVNFQVLFKGEYRRQTCKFKLESQAQMAPLTRLENRNAAVYLTFVAALRTPSYSFEPTAKWTTSAVPPATAAGWCWKGTPRAGYCSRRKETSLCDTPATPRCSPHR